MAVLVPLAFPPHPAHGSSFILLLSLPLPPHSPLSPSSLSCSLNARHLRNLKGSLSFPWRPHHVQISILYCFCLMFYFHLETPSWPGGTLITTDLTVRAVYMSASCLDQSLQPSSLLTLSSGLWKYTLPLSGLSSAEQQRPGCDPDLTKVESASWWKQRLRVETVTHVTLSPYGLQTSSCFLAAAWQVVPTPSVTSLKILFPWLKTRWVLLCSGFAVWTS